jgi:hypothetical protein
LFELDDIWNKGLIKGIFTGPLFAMTPVLSHIVQLAMKLPSITSVRSLSPMIAIWFGWVTFGGV